MPSIQDPLVIITDLDGSLLDHHTYGWQPAERWLATLKAHDVPVVFCSSKTAAEIVPLQIGMGLQGSPFIAENGALWQFYHHRQANDPQPAMVMGHDYASIRAIMQRLRESYGFKFFGFGDVDHQVISEWTGLTPQNALLAQQRQASETFIWREGDQRLAEFTALLAQDNLGVTQGGRFYHVMSTHISKGAALRQLLARFQQQDGRRRQSLGLGDGPNDISMLNAVDYAVIVQGYSNTPVELDARQRQVYRTQAYGPEGWSEGMDHFITLG